MRVRRSKDGAGHRARARPCGDVRALAGVWPLGSAMGGKARRASGCARVCVATSRTTAGQEGTVTKAERCGLDRCVRMRRRRGRSGQLAACAALHREAVFHGRKSKGAGRSPVLSGRPKRAWLARAEAFARRYPRACCARNACGCGRAPHECVNGAGAGVCDRERERVRDVRA